MYPEAVYSFGRWGYQADYQSKLYDARSDLEADPLHTAKALMRSGNPGGAREAWPHGHAQREGG